MGSWLAANCPCLARAGSSCSKYLSQGCCGRRWEGAGVRRPGAMIAPGVSKRAPAHTVLFFQESDIKWASRWDTYLTMSDVQIHWFSIINSVVVVFFLSGE